MQKMAGIAAVVCGVVLSVGQTVCAETVDIKAGHYSYRVDPATLQIDAVTADSAVIPILPPLHAPEAVQVTSGDGGWRWSDAAGRNLTLRADGNALSLTITAPQDSKLDWPLPVAATGTWLVPDGEGVAYGVEDAFWRQQYKKERCLTGTGLLSFPAWSHLSDSRAVTYALADGLQSKLCLRDEGGLQTRLRHDFSEGVQTLEILLSVGAPDPLAPALYYRQLMMARGQFVPLAGKAVPDLPRLYGAPQAYVWGDGRGLDFLDELKALGIERINLSYDQDPRGRKHIVTPAWLERAYQMGYLAGPYEDFANGQPAETADAVYTIWPDDLFPSGCVQGKDGKPVAGFGDRGCEMSSEAIRLYPGPFIPSQRYAAYRAEGAGQVFVDVDAFGNFSHDDSPAHPMTKSRDRENRLARLDIGISQHHLVLGSENVNAWSTGVTHYSHGTAQSHSLAVWPLLADARFNGWWPADEAPLFFKPFTPTPDEARSLFGAADRLPLFEAAFHDSVIASDRWEFGLMKVVGEERSRFLTSLLYGTPTLWNLNRRELKRSGVWLKAAHDAFRRVHGWGEPAALTGFAWLTPDRLVQQTRFADGRRLTGNFGGTPWQGLGPQCLRVEKAGEPAFDICPPPLPAPYTAKPWSPE